MNASVAETNDTPPHGWTCFHCDEDFTDEAKARDHFGSEQEHHAGCIDKLTAPEKNLVLALRKVCDEFHTLQLQVSEEITNDVYFYDRLRSSLASIKPFAKCISLHEVFNLFDSMEGRALAAEERAAEAKAMAERTLAEGVSILNELNGLKPDALRWRAVLGCARIRALGSAGLYYANIDVNGYAFLTIELWTIHEEPSDAMAVEWLRRFADLAVRVKNGDFEKALA